MINLYNYIRNVRSNLLYVIPIIIICNISAISQTIPKIPLQKNDRAIPGQYIVVYKSNSKATSRTVIAPTIAMRKQMMEEEVATTLVKNNLSSKKVTHIYETVINGFAVDGLTAKELELLHKDDQIAYIVPNNTRSINQVPNSASQILASDCNTSTLTINGANNTNILFADFGSTTDVTAEVALVNDGSADPTFACNSIVNNLTGKIALIDRGVCGFSQKAYSAQLAGAIGVIIANNTDDGNPIGMGPSPGAELVTIPVISISKTAGNVIKSALSSTVTATIHHGTLGATAQCTPWGIERVGGGLSGVGKRAWIIDSGIDLDHPDLNVNIALSQYFAGLSPDDQFGHGTHVAGTVAAIDNGIGVIGVAAGAELISLRVFDQVGASSDAQIIAAMNHAGNFANMDDVVNMSLGGWPNKAFDDALFALSLKTRVVVSAGNESTDANFAGPARVNAPNVYTISAMDRNNHLAGFSNFGNAPIDYAAPGVGIASCDLNGTYSFKNGTSMAAPHVAGLLLLGGICSDSKIIGDVDGKPDPIAVHLNPLTAPNNDGDLFSVCAGDLDDADATIYPGAPELCDGKDNDGDGIIDNECCPDGQMGILYVNASATGINSGVSWEHAFTSLQAALTAAKKCSLVTQIWVAKGTYYPSENQFGQTTPADPRTKSFAMQNNLAIYGGFAGNEPSDFNLSNRDMISNKTELSGEIQQDNLIHNNAYHVILNFPPYENPLNHTAVLDGFTIVGGAATMLVGNTDAHLPHSFGGGIMTYGSAPTIQRCYFLSSQGYFGGGMSNFESNTSTHHSQFIGNAAQYGAGIFNSLSNGLVTNSSFQLNNADSGGGIFQLDSAPTIINSSFSANKASSNGGAIYNVNSLTKIKNNILWGNNSEIEAGDGSDLSYNIIQGWTDGGNNNLNVDPKFIQQPSVDGDIIGNLNLLRCSPAINVGDPATNLVIVGTTDLIDNPRIFGVNIDLGAYEVQSEPLIVTTNVVANPGLTIESGESTTLTASGASTYLWSTTETSPAITVAPTVTTTYTVTGTTESCTMARSVDVVVIPLPVTLINFEAKKESDGTVKLSWTTAHEMNNDHYELERSTDLKHIEVIAKVAASEIGSQINTYHHSDELPYQGTSYYRLKQIDYNGYTKKYNWISIVNDQAYLAFPNPVRHKQFQVQLDEPEKATIKLYSQDGKLVPLQKTPRGTNKVELNLPKHTSPGIYLLQVEERAQNRQYKIIVD